MDSKDTCPKGDKHKYVTDEESGEIICLKCGNVEKLESNILEYKDRPEAEDGKKFVLGSFVGQTKKDRKKVKKKLPYLEKYDENLDRGNKMIEKYARALTSKTIVIERAQKIFIQARKLRRQIEPLAAACVLYACRENKISVSPNKLSKISHIKEKKFTSIYRKIHEMKGKLLPLDKAINKVRPVASKVGLPEKIVRKAEKILDEIPGSETGPSPIGIAGAMLFLVSKETKYSVTQKQLAKAVGVNPQTIMKSVKKLNVVLKKYKIKLS